MKNATMSSPKPRLKLNDETTNLHYEANHVYDGNGKADFNSNDNAHKAIICSKESVICATALEVESVDRNLVLDKSNDELLSKENLVSELKETHGLSDRRFEERIEHSISKEAKARISFVLNEVEQYSDIEKLFLYLQLPTRCSPDNDPLKQKCITNPLGKKSDIEVAQTYTWIQSHLAEDPEVSLPKHEVYEEYKEFCEGNNIEPLCAADFGKVMKHIFPAVKPRRLGTRGNSRYCYSGLCKKLDVKVPILPEISQLESSSQENLPSRESDEINNASCHLIFQWAEKLFGEKFSSLPELACYLLHNLYVDCRSIAALTVLSSVVKQEEDSGSQTVNKQMEIKGSRHRETQMYLQRKLQEKGLIKEQKKKLLEQKAELSESLGVKSHEDNFQGLKDEAPYNCNATKNKILNLSISEKHFEILKNNMCTKDNEQEWVPSYKTEESHLSTCEQSENQVSQMCDLHKTTAVKSRDVNMLKSNTVLLTKFISGTVEPKATKNISKCYEGQIKLENLLEYSNRNIEVPLIESKSNPCYSSHENETLVHGLCISPDVRKEIGSFYCENSSDKDFKVDYSRSDNISSAVNNRCDTSVKNSCDILNDTETSAKGKLYFPERSSNSVENEKYSVQNAILDNHLNSEQFKNAEENIFSGPASVKRVSEASLSISKRPHLDLLSSKLKSNVSLDSLSSTVAKQQNIPEEQETKSYFPSSVPELKYVKPQIGNSLSLFNFGSGRYSNSSIEHYRRNVEGTNAFSGSNSDNYWNISTDKQSEKEIDKQEMPNANNTENSGKKAQLSQLRMLLERNLPPTFAKNMNSVKVEKLMSNQQRVCSLKNNAYNTVQLNSKSKLSTMPHSQQTLHTNEIGGFINKHLQVEGSKSSHNHIATNPIASGENIFTNQYLQKSVSEAKNLKSFSNSLSQSLASNVTKISNVSSSEVFAQPIYIETTAQQNLDVHKAGCYPQVTSTLSNYNFDRSEINEVLQQSPVKNTPLNSLGNTACFNMQEYFDNMGSMVSVAVGPSQPSSTTSSPFVSPRSTPVPASRSRHSSGQNTQSFLRQMPMPNIDSGLSSNSSSPFLSPQSTPVSLSRIRHNSTQNSNRPYTLSNNSNISRNAPGFTGLRIRHSSGPGGLLLPSSISTLAPRSAPLSPLTGDNSRKCFSSLGEINILHNNSNTNFITVSPLSSPVSPSLPAVSAEYNSVFHKFEINNNHPTLSSGGENSVSSPQSFSRFNYGKGTSVQNLPLQPEYGNKSNLFFRKDNQLILPNAFSVCKDANYKNTEPGYQELYHTPDSDAHQLPFTDALSHEVQSLLQSPMNLGNAPNYRSQSVPPNQMLRNLIDQCSQYPSSNDSFSKSYPTTPIVNQVFDFTSDLCHSNKMALNVSSENINESLLHQKSAISNIQNVSYIDLASDECPNPSNSNMPNLHTVADDLQTTLNDLNEFDNDFSNIAQEIANFANMKEKL